MQPPFAAPDPFKVLNRVGDVHRVALDPRLFQRPIEQPPRRSDKGLTLLVLLIARLLASRLWPFSPCYFEYPARFYCELAINKAASETGVLLQTDLGLKLLREFTSLRRGILTELRLYVYSPNLFAPNARRIGR